LRLELSQKKKRDMQVQLTIQLAALARIHGGDDGENFYDQVKETIGFTNHESRIT
jgi:hypothetical protein